MVDDPQRSQEREIIRIVHQPLWCMEAKPQRHQKERLGSGHRPLAGDPHYRATTALLHCSRKCFFSFTAPLRSSSLFYISSLFIQGAPEEPTNVLVRGLTQSENVRLHVTVPSFISSICIQKWGLRAQMTTKLLCLRNFAFTLLLLVLFTL